MTVTRSSENFKKIQANDYYSEDGSAGITDTFNNADGDIVTIKEGLITSITTP